MFVELACFWDLDIFTDMVFKCAASNVVILWVSLPSCCRSSLVSQRDASCGKAFLHTSHVNNKLHDLCQETKLCFFSLHKVCSHNGRKKVMTMEKNAIVFTLNSSSLKVHIFPATLIFCYLLQIMGFLYLLKKCHFLELDRTVVRIFCSLAEIFCL